MKQGYLIIALAFLLFMAQGSATAQTYAGNERCVTCHSSVAIGGNQFPVWKNTLHARNLLPPSDSTIIPSSSFITGQTISMGSAFNNAQVILSKVGADFFAQVGTGGQSYRVVYAQGWGWKQRFIIRIENSFYMLPIQFNLTRYMTHPAGTWVVYEGATWFNSNGTVKPLDNAFRRKSWERDCMGCHAAVGFNVTRVITGTDTAWTGQWANSNSPANLNVGCEYCHGPSSTHFGGTTGTINPKNLPNKDRKLEVCGQCHIRGSSWRGAGLAGTHGYPFDEINGRYFKPGDTLRNYFNMTLPPNATGSYATWPDLLTARSHRQQYQDYVGSGHYTTTSMEITCFTCHAAHRPTPNPHLVTDSLTVGATRFRVRNEDNTLCLACHATQGSFAGIQRAWVQNPVAFHDSIGRVVNRHSKHNLYDPLNTNSTGGSGRCSQCHMTKTAVNTLAYDYTWHRFAVVSPNKTLLYQGVSTPTLGMLNSCSYPCHRNPSGPTANVPSFGVGTDPTLTNWREPTDIALADTLWRYWRLWGFTNVKEIAGTIPTEFRLSQNYPNPFNPSTTIVVDIPRSETVRLVIYNIAGQRVATIMDGAYATGKYEVVWNGRDDFRYHVSTGVYLYRLEAGSFSASKKMLMVK